MVSYEFKSFLFWLLQHAFAKWINRFAETTFNCMIEHFDTLICMGVCVCVGSIDDNGNIVSDGLIREKLQTNAK